MNEKDYAELNRTIKALTARVTKLESDVSHLKNQVSRLEGTR